jgi:tetratricopeptide (TPR) repeat protein
MKQTYFRVLIFLIFGFYVFPACFAQEEYPITVKGMNEIKTDASLSLNSSNTYLSNGESSVTTTGSPLSEPERHLELQEYGPLSGHSKEELDLSQAYVLQAIAKLKNGAYEAALGDISKSIDIDDRNPSAYVVKAEIDAKLEKYYEAVFDATKALKIASDNPGALRIRAWSLAQMGQFAPALADISRAIRVKSGSAQLLYTRALIYEKNGDYSPMSEDLKKSVELDSSYSQRANEILQKHSDRLDGEVKSAIIPKVREKMSFSVKHKNKIKLVAIALFVAGLLVFLLSKVSSIFGWARLATKATFMGFGSILSFGGAKKSKAKVLMKQFTVLRQLGEGGMGIVYEAYDQALKRKVAIKKMRSEFNLDPESKKQLLAEARTVASLKHNNIVEIYGIFEEGGDLFLVFEYVEGRTLEEILDTEGKFTFSDIKPVFHAVCKALQYAHDNNVIHRDLKPGNIMVTTDGIIKVMDFGVARQITNLRKSNTMSGTPAYMSPEQMRGAVRKESDIYSLGVCLYEMLVGHVPWDLEGYSSVQGKVVPISGIIPSVPKNIDALIEKALQEDPSKRPQSPSDFWDILKNIGTAD